MHTHTHTYIHTSLKLHDLTNTNAVSTVKFKRPKVNVHKFLCRYELHGECKDSGCKDLHLKDFFPPGYVLPARTATVHAQRKSAGM